MKQQPLTTWAEIAKVLEDLGPAIRTQRRRKGLSLREAADDAGVSFSTLSRWENGKDVQSLELLRGVLRWLQT